MILEKVDVSQSGSPDLPLIGLTAEDNPVTSE
jgi:hypothetical protein